MKSFDYQLTKNLPLVLQSILVAIAIILAVNTGVAMADGLVIRGGTCSAAAFKNGASSAQQVKGDYYLTGLSVNCTTATNNKANHVNYHNGIGGYGQYCVATMKSLQLLNVKITTDPVTGNPYHCLLSGNAKNIAKKLTRY